MSQSKVLFAFNRLSIRFIKFLKQQDDQLRASIKKNYKVFKNTNETLVKFHQALQPHHALFWTEAEPWNVLAAAADCEVLKALTIAKIIKQCPEEAHPTILWYLHVLYFLSTLYSDWTEEKNEEIEVLFTKWSQIAGEASDNKVEEVLAEVLDDDTQNFLMKIRALGAALAVTPVEETTGGIDQMFQGTCIGDIAKDCAEEFAKTLDPSMIETMNSPADLFSLDASGGNLIGNMIQKVGSRITADIAAGKISQEALMGEAMSMFGKMQGMGGGGGPGGDMISSLMSQMGTMMGGGGMDTMMKAMMGGGQPTPRGRTGTRDRLRKRLEAAKPE